MNSFLGILFGTLAGMSWGVMAVAAQYLLGYCSFTPEDLVSVRLAGAGLMMLAIEAAATRRNVFACLRSLRNVRDIAFYAFGLLSGQYTFFLSIRYANAGTATILVGTIPIFLMLWGFLRQHRKPLARELVCIVLAFGGVALLVTKGDFTSLDFSVAGVFWGLVSALAAAYNTIQPQAVVKRAGLGPTIGWSMMMAGLAACAVYPPWQAHAVWSAMAIFAYGLVVLVGTVGAFWFYLMSTRYVPAVVSGLLTSAEPLTAVILCVVLFQTGFTAWELVGAAAILSNLGILALGARRSRC